MPYIKSINGVMQEFNSSGVNTGSVATVGLNSYSYLERRNWSATSSAGTSATNPDYTVDFPYLTGQGFKYIQVMTAPFSGTGTYGWGNVVGNPTFNSDNSVSALNINQSYWDCMDNFFNSALSNNLGIICCFFWRAQAIPELVGETDAGLSSGTSKTRNYMRAFAAAFVARYATHKGIAFWMANQELQNIATLSVNDIHNLQKEVGVAIRANDSLGRMISGGNAALAHQDPKQGSLTLCLRDRLAFINPDPLDCIQEHPFITTEYLSTAMASNFSNPGDYSSTDAYLTEVQKVCADLGKPYYAGSFGVSTTQETSLGDTTQTNLTTFLTALRNAGVQLCAYWAWNSPAVAIWNVITGSGTDNGRSAVLTALLAAKTAWATSLGTAPKKGYPLVLKPRYNTALDFGANKLTTNGITIPHISAYASSDFSVFFSIYFRANSGVAFQSIMNKSGTNTGWSLSDYLNGKTPYFQIFDGSAPTKSTAGALSKNDTPGIWIRLGYTIKQNGSVSEYIDGFMNKQTGLMSTPYSPGSNALKIGRYTGSNASVADFILSNLVIYNRALTPAEAYIDFTTGNAPSPVGLWKFDGDLLDYSGNNNTAQLGLNGQTNPAFIQVAPSSRSATNTRVAY